MATATKIKVRNRANGSIQELTQEEFDTVSKDKIWYRTFERLPEDTPPEVAELQRKQQVEQKPQTGAPDNNKKANQ